MKPWGNVQILHAVVLLAMAIVVGLFMGGCGGGGNNSPSQSSTSPWVQGADATYLGRARCRDCHAETDDQYATSAHGKNFHTAYIDFPTMGYGGDMLTQRSGACAHCHVTGEGYPSGWTQTDPPTTALEGIGCESCHGPGSKHVAASTVADRKANITLVPTDTATCWQCHVNGSYRALDTPYVPTTASSLLASKANSVAPHHPQAFFLNGKLGYNVTTPVQGPHQSIPNTCVACHLKKEVNPANGLMDHSAASLEPDLDFTQPVCASCHSGRDDGAFMEGVKAKLIELGGADANGNPDSTCSGGLLNAYATANSLDLNSTTNGTDPMIQNYKAARYNFQCFMNDKSLGVHNPALANKLLSEAKAYLTSN